MPVNLLPSPKADQAAVDAAQLALQDAIDLINAAQIEVATRNELPTLEEAGNLLGIRILEPFRGGYFIVTKADISAAVAADASGLQPIHIPFPSTDGSTGGYVRDLERVNRTERHVEAGWFLDDPTDWNRAIAAADAYLYGKTLVQEGGIVELPGGLFLPTKTNAYIRTPYLVLKGNYATLMANKEIDPDNPDDPHGNGSVEFHGTGCSAEKLNIESNAHGFLTGRGQGGTFDNIQAQNCEGCGHLFGGSQHGQIGWAVLNEMRSFNCRGGGVALNCDSFGIPATEAPYLVSNRFPAGYNDYPEFQHNYIINSGTGYTDGWHSVNITGGAGQYATAVVEVRGGAVVKCTIQSCGIGYAEGDEVGIESPESGVESSIGDGTGFLYKVLRLIRITGFTTTKSWFNANPVTNLSIRQCSHFGLVGYGSIGYNDYTGAQIEGNKFTGPTIKGEFAASWFRSAHIVQPSIAASGISDTQPMFEWIGSARNNAFIDSRLTAPESNMTREQMMGSESEVPTAWFADNLQYVTNLEQGVRWTSAQLLDQVGADILTSPSPFFNDRPNTLHSSRITSTVVNANTAGHSLTVDLAGFEEPFNRLDLIVKVHVTRNLSTQEHQFGSGQLSVAISISTDGSFTVKTSPIFETDITFGTPTLSDDYLLEVPYSTTNPVGSAVVRVTAEDFNQFNGTHTVPPSFDTSPVTTATEDSAYTYTVNTSAISGNAITLAATTLPAWLTFTDNEDDTGTLAGTPLTADVGTHSVKLSADDGVVKKTQTFEVEVVAA